MVDLAEAVFALLIHADRLSIDLQIAKNQRIRTILHDENVLICTQSNWTESTFVVLLHGKVVCAHWHPDKTYYIFRKFSEFIIVFP